MQLPARDLTFPKDMPLIRSKMTHDSTALVDCRDNKAAEDEAVRAVQKPN